MDSNEESLYAFVIPEAVNIRSGPSTHDIVIGQLPKDERVEVIYDMGEWYKVKSANIEGYVVSAYLRLDKKPLFFNEE
jgi:uncharacterized protein YgiM (DUF1202 family)